MFGKALERYNAKQKRRDCLIDSCYEKIGGTSLGLKVGMRMLIQSETAKNILQILNCLL